MQLLSSLLNLAGIFFDLLGDVVESPQEVALH